ncbi:MAG: hypothetical protein SFW35_11920 [Chitinophagales bacterium]|nr:hypothetical protein [Chitinophagales bacterium]
MEELLEILKYTLPSIVLVVAVYLILNSFFASERKQAQMKALEASRKDLLALRLQAYERLAVFLERNHPSSLVPRTNDHGLTVREYQHILIDSINTEFEHNLSQQLYVSQEAWASVRFVKDNTIKVINLVATSTEQQLPSTELAKKLLDYYLQSDQGIPAQKALNVINMEVKKLFGNL